MLKPSTIGIISSMLKNSVHPLLITCGLPGKKKWNHTARSVDEISPQVAAAAGINALSAPIPAAMKMPFAIL